MMLFLLLSTIVGNGLCTFLSDPASPNQVGAAAAAQPRVATNTATQCLHYNASCGGSGSSCEPTVTQCVKDMICFTVWENSTDTDGNPTVKLHKQGCIVSHSNELDHCNYETECLGTSYGSNDIYFCCCAQDNCNRDYRIKPAPLVSESMTTPSPLVPPPHNSYLILYCLIPVLVVILVACAMIYVYRQRKSSHFSSLSQSDEGPVSPPTPNITHRPIELLEIKARGRFGAVWKGQLNDRLVAVKIFPLQDKQSWVAEQEIYKLPQMTHANILEFLGVDKRGDNLQQEFWLVSAFHERGSLCDYLKGNTVSLDELCRLTQGIAAGLTHLHTEIPATTSAAIKPAIAHRDFKSKNVLMKSDMTACIGDFGLALQFKPNEIVGDTHGQVGTRRYMAPEVLEGAINFSRDAFLRIDMYACGLVLWEVLSRCRDVANVQSYKLPFEVETSPHPTLEEISDLVVMRKVRPDLKEIWRKHEALSLLCETIEECWDHDAEARLSASCVLERLQLIKSIVHSMDNTNADEETRLTCQETLNNSINSQQQQQHFQNNQPEFIMRSLNTNIEHS